MSGDVADEVVGLVVGDAVELVMSDVIGVVVDLWVEMLYVKLLRLEMKHVCEVVETSNVLLMYVELPHQKFFDDY